MKDSTQKNTKLRITHVREAVNEESKMRGREERRLAKIKTETSTFRFFFSFHHNSFRMNDSNVRRKFKKSLHANELLWEYRG